MVRLPIFLPALLIQTRGLITLVLIFMVTRAISASRRGDGYRGPLV